MNGLGASRLSWKLVFHIVPRTELLGHGRPGDYIKKWGMEMVLTTLILVFNDREEWLRPSGVMYPY